MNYIPHWMRSPIQPNTPPTTSPSQPTIVPIFSISHVSPLTAPITGMMKKPTQSGIASNFDSKPATSPAHIASHTSMPIAISAVTAATMPSTIQVIGLASAAVAIAKRDAVNAMTAGMAVVKNAAAIVTRLPIIVGIA